MSKQEIIDSVAWFNWFEQTYVVCNYSTADIAIGKFSKKIYYVSNLTELGNALKRELIICQNKK